MKYLVCAGFVLINVILFSSTATAQENRSFISISSGYSLPVGKFAKAKPDDPLSGLAGSGFYGQLNYDQKVKSWLGFRFSASFNNNKTNDGPIIEKANSYIIGTGKTYSWQSNVSKWKLGAALIGPAIYLNYQKLTIEGHIQAGFVTARTPSVTLSGKGLGADGQVDPNSTQIDITMEQKTVTPFGLAGGLSVRYPLYKKLFIHINTDIIGARAQVKNLAIKAKVGTLELSEQLTDKRFIGVVNIGGGLGFAF